MSQRLALYLVVAVVIVLGIVLGGPAEDPQGTVMELIAPIVALLVGTGFHASVINNRVFSQEVEPGDITAILKMRETWALFVLMGAWLLQRFGIVDGLVDAGGEATFQVDLVVNTIMSLASLFIFSHIERGAGKTVEFLEVTVGDMSDAK